MLEWELIVEYNRIAAQAAEAARENKQKNGNGENQKFQAFVKELMENLERLQYILSHEDRYVQEELADALNRIAGEPAGYHTVQHYEINKK